MKNIQLSCDLRVLEYAHCFHWSTLKSVTKMKKRKNNTQLDTNNTSTSSGPSSHA